MKRLGSAWMACFFGLLSAGVAAAADAPSTAEVLGKVHQSDQREIMMGKMAQGHGMSKDVRDFGKTLVKDHTAADKKVMKLARDEKLDLPTSTPAADTTRDTRYTGSAFDDAFAKDMLADHKKDVAEVTAARDATTDAKLKKLLTDILPVLTKHEEIAQKLVDRIAKT